MRLANKELLAIGVLIVYIAFFSNSPPTVVQDILRSPIGHIVILIGVLYLTAYQSLLIGIFAGIAYIMTARKVTEYLDEKEQTPKEEKKPQPKSEGVPPPAVTGVMQSLLKKGDSRLPATNGKSDTVKPVEKAPPKPATPEKLSIKESFSERFSPF